MSTLTDTNPSFGLKLQTFLCQASLLGLILAVNIGSIVLNLYGSRPYVLVLYASLRLLTPGGLFGMGKSIDGGSWRFYSETLFFQATVMRKYLELSFAPVPPELAKAEAQENAQFVFAAFPHGCNSDFRALMDGVLGEVLPNLIRRDAVRALAASILFKIAIVREIALWTGCIDASRKIAEKALDQHKSLVVLPGGEAEQIRTTYGKEKVYLSNRKGFIKLAMRKGVPVVPMYVFGSSDAYYTFHDDDDKSRSKKFDWTFYDLRHKLMKNFGVCIMICTGLWWSYLCPLPKKTTIVFGKPIYFQPASNSSQSTSADATISIGFEPSAEELDQGHALFVKELTALFDAHKTELGYGDRTLEVI